MKGACRQVTVSGCCACQRLSHQECSSPVGLPLPAAEPVSASTGRAADADTLLSSSGCCCTCGHAPTSLQGEAADHVGTSAWWQTVTAAHLHTNVSLLHLQELLLAYGEYPSRYRLMIWEFLLRLPHNTGAHQARLLLLSAHAGHPELTRLPAHSVGHAKSAALQPLQAAG